MGFIYLFIYSFISVFCFNFTFACLFSDALLCLPSFVRPYQSIQTISRERQLVFSYTTGEKKKSVGGSLFTLCINLFVITYHIH